ncbi:MAG: glycosyl hydrolase family 18 protein [Actinomycetota bacterium]
MRSLWPVVVLVVAACAPSTATSSTVSTAPPEPSTTPATSATTVPSSTTEPRVKLVLSDEEAVAVAGDVRLEVRDASGRVLGWLDQDRRELAVPSSTKRVTLRYPGEEGSPGAVSWEQETEAPVTVIRQPWRGDRRCSARLPDGSTAPVALVWQSGAESSTYLEQLDRAGDVVNVVSPIWWRMRADGTVASFADAGYVSSVHDRNVAVWPAVAGFDADVHHVVFSSPQRRSALATQISEEARRIGADGVNIDVEGYRVEDSDDFLAWVEELADLVHGWGGTVSYDLVPRSDTWDVTPEDLEFWSTAPQRTALSRVTDCTILMAYDEHNRYRPAGPVASPAWVEEVLTYELRHADPAELVLGVPFYVRIWDPAELDSPAAVGIGELDSLIDQGEVSHDPATGLDRVVLPDGRFFWTETAGGLKHRFDLVDGYGLAGWAAWRFGFDGPEIWELMESRGG